MPKRRKFLIQAYFPDNPSSPPSKVLLPGDIEISPDDNIQPSSDLSEVESINGISSLPSFSDSSDSIPYTSTIPSSQNNPLFKQKPISSLKPSKKQIWSDEVKVLISLFHRSSDLNLTKSKVKDVRLLVATMHTETHPISQIRGKCSVSHISQIQNLQQNLSLEDNFYYSALYDRYITRLYDVIPVSCVKNVPPPVKKKLLETYQFIICEPSKTLELTMDLKACDVCHEWCTSANSMTCSICNKPTHMACLDPPIIKKPSKGYAWQCAPCLKALYEEKIKNNQLLLSNSERTRAAASAGKRKIYAISSNATEYSIDDVPKDTPRSTRGSTGSIAEVTKTLDPIPPKESPYYKTLSKNDLLLSDSSSLPKKNREWPYRYFGIYSNIDDVLNDDDRINPRAGSRIGPKYQAVIPDLIDANSPFSMKHSHRGRNPASTQSTSRITKSVSESKYTSRSLKDKFDAEQREPSARLLFSPGAASLSFSTESLNMFISESKKIFLSLMSGNIDFGSLDATVSSLMALSSNNYKITTTSSSIQKNALSYVRENLIRIKPSTSGQKSGSNSSSNSSSTSPSLSSLSSSNQNNTNQIDQSKVNSDLKPYFDMSGSWYSWTTNDLSKFESLIRDHGSQLSLFPKNIPNMPSTSIVLRYYRFSNSDKCKSLMSSYIRSLNYVRKPTLEIDLDKLPSDSKTQRKKEPNSRNKTRNPSCVGCKTEKSSKWYPLPFGSLVHHKDPDTISKLIKPSTSVEKTLIEKPKIIPPFLENYNVPSEFSSYVQIQNSYSGYNQSICRKCYSFWCKYGVVVQEEPPKAPSPTTSNASINRHCVICSYESLSDYWIENGGASKIAQNSSDSKPAFKRRKKDPNIEGFSVGNEAESVNEALQLNGKGKKKNSFKDNEPDGFSQKVFNLCADLGVNSEAMWQTDRNNWVHSLCALLTPGLSLKFSSNFGKSRIFSNPVSRSISETPSPCLSSSGSKFSQTENNESNENTSPPTDQLKVYGVSLLPKAQFEEVIIIIFYKILYLLIIFVLSGLLFVQEIVWVRGAGVHSLHPYCALILWRTRLGSTENISNFLSEVFSKSSNKSFIINNEKSQKNLETNSNTRNISIPSPINEGVEGAITNDPLNIPNSFPKQQDITDSFILENISIELVLNTKSPFISQGLLPYLMDDSKKYYLENLHKDLRTNSLNFSKFVELSLNSLCRKNSNRFSDNSKFSYILNGENNSLHKDTLDLNQLYYNSNLLTLKIVFASDPQKNNFSIKPWSNDRKNFPLMVIPLQSMIISGLIADSPIKGSTIPYTFPKHLCFNPYMGYLNDFYSNDTDIPSHFCCKYCSTLDSPVWYPTHSIKMRDAVDSHTQSDDWNNYSVNPQPTYREQDSLHLDKTRDVEFCYQPLMTGLADPYEFMELIKEESISNSLFEKRNIRSFDWSCVDCFFSR
ncbi:Lid2 complex component snt2 [Smittium mucronatum]|uniref:Lid2 complex component snt2 n=1 Tax=Smittium mucronatum TaxID=133383 RepID=A0A1R0GW16_9FUNG|nr:Lid2 complex component snt2 [Smittium mucronatum]